MSADPRRLILKVEGLIIPIVRQPVVSTFGANDQADGGALGYAAPIMLARTGVRALDMNVIWTMYRAAYPERAEQRPLIAQ